MIMNEDFKSTVEDELESLSALSDLEKKKVPLAPRVHLHRVKVNSAPSLEGPSGRRLSPASVA